MAGYSQTSGARGRGRGRGRGTGFMYKLKMFLVIAATVFLIFSFFWGESGFIRLWYIDKKIEKVERDIKILKVQRNDLLWETDKIKNDPDYLQRYAIETYGYAKPDQKIIQFVPADTSSSPGVRPTAASKSRNP
jgi:cell division protein FtsB